MGNTRPHRYTWCAQVQIANVSRFSLCLFLFSVDDIKNKFKNLRTTFQRQAKQVAASRASGGGVFQPQWKHYQQLTFLLQDADQAPASPQTQPLDNEATPNPPGATASFLHPTSMPLPGSSPCDTFNAALKCYWTEEREKQLIAFYAGEKATVEHAGDL